MKILTVGSAMRDIFIKNSRAESIHLCTGEQQQSFIILEEGRKTEIDTVESFSGGGAVNTAVSFMHLGNEVRSCFKTGTDPDRDFVLAKIAQHNIDVSYAQQSESTPTGNSFILPCPSGNCTILINRGANLTLTVDDITEEAIAWCDLLYVTSLSGPAGTVLPVIAHKAQQQNKTVILNPGTTQLTANIKTLVNALPFANLLILNAYEAQLLMSSFTTMNVTQAENNKESLPDDFPELLRSPISPTTSCFTLRQFFRTILAHGPQMIVVTNGAEGVYAADSTAIYFHPSLDTNVVSTLGAGDAFGSTFASHLYGGTSVEKSLLAGVINSSYVLQHYDTQTGLLNKKALEEKLASHTTDDILTYPL